MFHSLYIPDNNTFNGGPLTFMLNLKQYFDKESIKYCHSINNATSIFFPMTHNLEELNLIKLKSGKIIQRLDGIYYPQKHGLKYLEINALYKHIYLFYSDYYIFQSEYSKKQCFKFLGELNSKKYCIIYNGANQSIFYPDTNKKKIDNTIRIVNIGSYRNIEMLEILIKATDLLFLKNRNIQLNIVGEIHKDILINKWDRPYINWHGKKQQNEIAVILRENDIFLHTQQNDNCPNSVVEAISCGLPVVGFSSGSMPELCFFSNDLLAEVSDDLFQKYEDFDPEKLCEKIELCISDFNTFKQRALNNAHLYDFNETGKKYVEVLQKVVSKTQKSFGKKIANKIFANKYIFQLIKNKILAYPGIMFNNFILSLIDEKYKQYHSEQSLYLSFDFDNKLYKKTTKLAIEYEKGIHPKHRLMDYHAFFISNIHSGSTVLDIGCNTGELTWDILQKAKPNYILGIEIEESLVKTAKSSYSADNLDFICGDVCKYSFNGKDFNTIVLSNVLEHIEKRVELLQYLKEEIKPEKFLIRVPVYDRDWRIPLKEELGIDFRLDPTHYIEYTEGIFKTEIQQSGLSIISSSIQWGEIWAIVQ